MRYKVINNDKLLSFFFFYYYDEWIIWFDYGEIELVGRELRIDKFVSYDKSIFCFCIKIKISFVVFVLWFLSFLKI